jgi:hypothetical protein
MIRLVLCVLFMIIPVHTLSVRAHDREQGKKQRQCSECEKGSPAKCRPCK